MQLLSVAGDELHTQAWSDTPNMLSYNCKRRTIQQWFSNITHELTQEQQLVILTTDLDLFHLLFLALQALIKPGCGYVNWIV